MHQLQNIAASNGGKWPKLGNWETGENWPVILLQPNASMTSATCPETMAASKSPTTGCVTVDLEEYFQVEGYAEHIERSQWESLPFRADASTHKLLDLFSVRNAKVTFFVVGWFAERNKELVREIADRGHEIGCHSYGHQPIWRLSPEQFREDTSRAKGVLEDITGSAVLGYRAPTFSIVTRTLWALRILAELGFHYDSSVFPVHHDRYGIPEAPREFYQWSADGLSIYEMPPATIKAFGMNLPAAGGGYLRLLPMFYMKWAMARLRRESMPAILYLHPWDLDPDQPRFEVPRTTTFRHLHNAGKTYDRLATILRSLQSITMHAMLHQQIERGVAFASRPLA